MDPLKRGFDAAMGAAFLARFQNQMMAISEDALAAHIADNTMRGFALIGSEGNAIPVRREAGNAIVTITGVMMPDADYAGEVSTKELATIFDGLAEDSSVNGVIMEMDSPGGAVAGHQSLMESAKALASAKPLVTYVTGDCCSAAMWLAFAGSAIYAAPGSTLGSIGVRNHIYDVSKMFEDMGIKTIDISTGPFKSLGLMGTEVTPEQQAYLQARVDQVFAEFLEDMMVGRGMNKAQAKLLATGAVWYANDESVALNLLDGLRKPSATYADFVPAPARSPRKDLAMSNDTTVAEGPVAVTTAELKKKFPSSTAEWREEQTEEGATMADAAIAYAQFQEAKAVAAEKALAEATAAREAAEAAAVKPVDEPTKSKRGVSTPAAAAGEDDNSDGADYHELAKAYMEKHGCRYSVACLHVKKKYGDEAIASFNGPPARTRKKWSNS